MSGEPRKLTLRDFRKLYQQGERIVCLTAYDALIGRLIDEAGVPLILVGDSMGMTILGYPNTLHVTLEQSLHHTAAVVRGVKRGLVIGDMPFLSFQESPEQALRNAGRYLREAGADGVKIEGGQEMAPTVRRLVQAGIPVMGHIGLLPQKVIGEGGYRLYGRAPREADALMDDALALQKAGAFAIVLESIHAPVSKRLTEGLTIPTIGIGAGPHCSGQVQVVNDILGLFEAFVPKHTKRYGHLAEEIRRLVGQYANEVRQGTFPGPEQTFT